MPLGSVLILYILIALLFTYKYRRGLSTVSEGDRPPGESESDRIRTDVEKERLKVEKKKIKAEAKARKKAHKQ